MIFDNRVIQKLQFLNNFLMKTAFLQGFSPKKCETVREPTGFPNKSNISFIFFGSLPSAIKLNPNSIISL